MILRLQFSVSIYNKDKVNIDMKKGYFNFIMKFYSLNKNLSQNLSFEINVRSYTYLTSPPSIPIRDDILKDVLSRPLKKKSSSILLHESSRQKCLTVILLSVNNCVYLKRNGPAVKVLGFQQSYRTCSLFIIIFNDLN